MTARTRSTQPNATAPVTPASPKSRRRGANATPPADVAPATTPEVDPLVTMLGFADPKAAGKTAKVKAEAVKQAARRELAQTLVSAYAAAFAEIPADSPIFTALGREAAAQFASNWVHHLPITAAAFGEHLPLPKRSNWDADVRK